MDSLEYTMHNNVLSHAYKSSGILEKNAAPIAGPSHSPRRGAYSRPLELAHACSYLQSKAIREGVPLINPCSRIAHTISIRGGHQAEKVALHLLRIS